MLLDIGAKRSQLNILSLIDPKPSNVRPVSVSQSGVRIDWSYEDSCYMRTGLDVTYTTSAGHIVPVDLPINATTLSIEGLTMAHTYTFRFVIYYGNQSSDELRYQVETGMYCNSFFVF